MNQAKPKQRIIQVDRSIIPACDVDLEKFEEIVKHTADVERVGAYKIGFQLGLTHGLPQVVKVARKYTDKPIIYDHQKAGTDIPYTGKNFARVCKEAGINAIILFPQAGPETEAAWIKAAFEQGLDVIVGGLMTHPKYMQSEGGYLDDEAIMKIYLNAAKLGVSDFVVPGNKPEAIKEIREALEAQGVKPVFYAPGFVAQGGSISDATRVAGDSWHAIVGRGIYWNKKEERYKTREEIRQAALEYTSQI